MNVVGYAGGHECLSVVTGGHGLQTIVELGSIMKGFVTRSIGRRSATTSLLEYVDRLSSLGNSGALSTRWWAPVTRPVCQRTVHQLNSLLTSFKRKLQQCAKRRLVVKWQQNYRQRRRSPITFSSALLVTSGQPSWAHHQSRVSLTHYQLTCWSHACLSCCHSLQSFVICITSARLSST